jgi:hypothetical protein
VITSWWWWRVCRCGSWSGAAGRAAAGRQRVRGCACACKETMHGVGCCRWSNQLYGEDNTVPCTVMQRTGACQQDSIQADRQPVHAHNHSCMSVSMSVWEVPAGCHFVTQLSNPALEHPGQTGKCTGSNMLKQQQS